MKLVLFVTSFLFLTTTFAAEKVFIVSPKNNAVVEKTFKVKFGLSGLKLKPAGEDMTNKKSGHYHLIIDGAFIPEGVIVPADEKHIHFGKAQTETEVTLASGKHTLTLQFADGAHISHGEKLSHTITVEVK